MNRQGQAFSAYKLLIGAIMGLAILTIIMGVIGYFEGLRVEIDRELFEDGFEAAVNSPDGKVIVKEITLHESTYTSKGLAEKFSGLTKDCIEFDAANWTAFNLAEGKQAIVIKKSVKAKVYYCCTLQGCPEGCNVCCRISFGRKIEAESE